MTLRAVSRRMALIQAAIGVEPFIEYVLQYVTDRPEQSTAAVVGVLGVLFNYNKTGSIPIGRMPWRYAREMLRDLGDKYFGVKRPRGVPGVLVEAPPERVIKALRGQAYESTDLYSYEYENEAWGLRRPSGTQTHPVTAEPVPMENHPRGFETEDGKTLIVCHDEASRFERTGLHLAETMLSWDRGQDYIAEDLDEANLGYQRIESETAAGVEVVEPSTRGPRS